MNTTNLNVVPEEENEGEDDEPTLPFADVQGRNDSIASTNEARVLGGHEKLCRRMSVPLHVLSKIVDSETLSCVCAHMELESACEEESPSALWERRKKQMEERKLNAWQIKEIEVGWRVRRQLQNLSAGETTGSAFLEIVQTGKVNEVNALLSLVRYGQRKDLNKNCKDNDDRSALDIAIDNKDIEMLRTLLRHNVDTGQSLFRAVSQDFFQAVEALVGHVDSEAMVIQAEDDHYRIGMTPMLLAAYQNNYRILTLLHRCGYRIEDPPQSSGRDETLESANKRKMIYKARAQPAYITLMCEANRVNPMKYCLREIQKLKTAIDVETEFNKYYKDIIDKHEDFMCSLLDMICSSNELAGLFKYNIDSSSDRHVAPIRNHNQLRLLEDAAGKRLVRFVTHHHSQLAITHLRYESTQFLRSLPYSEHAVSFLIGLLFPIFSLMYLIAPGSRIGGFLKLPTICFCCHTISEVVFIILLLLNLLCKTVEQDYLGAYPTTVEWLILFWILGKWTQEIRECFMRGPRAYFSDYWNYLDLFMLSLLQGGVIIRVIDVIKHQDHHDHISRSEWSSYEPRLIAEALHALAYVLVFMRLMGIMRVSRYLGPLQISLSRMLADILRFLWIYGLITCAFGIGIHELYWYYGTAEGSKMICQKTANETDCAVHPNRGFSTLAKSFTTLFWVSFGYMDVDEQMSLNGKHVFTQSVGRVLVAFYHVIAVLVMVNMLIAMMSKSYEVTSENEDTEYKFHRTSLWIHYIRQEVTRPPPMNLIPNPRRVINYITALSRGFKNKKGDEREKKSIAHEKSKHTRLAIAMKNLRRPNVQSKLVLRYKLKHLINK